VKILLCGDVVGRSGRDAIVSKVPNLRSRLGLDFVIVNGENAAHGFGITDKICESFFTAGVDVITTGNHAWDRREIMEYIRSEPRLLRPVNFAEGAPGQGAGVFKARDGRRILVINPMGQLFMGPVGDPFAALEIVLGNHRLGKSVEAIAVDVHAEATSEKMAIGHFLDGRVSVVVGTHTHVPTADARILAKGTAFQTDMGMCGDYDSVVGMAKDIALARFLDSAAKPRLEPAAGEATLCGLFVETDDITGLAKRVEPVRLGGDLSHASPG
jgi:2',3'-cyclic-nucleotide 2'-phosphodiesterase